MPILFNDRHVYAKPDEQKQNRVLAALVRKGEILVPLRSMFEAMGATVNYYAATKTVEVTKVGAAVKLTLDKPEVTINGEIRPLDVPPTIYKGAIVVPVRVISEGMGAYVLWLPEKRLVVVRYVAAPAATAAPAMTPPPAPPPTPVASLPPLPPPPSPAPAVKTPSPYEKFIVGDYIISPKVYNEFSPATPARTRSGSPVRSSSRSSACPGKSAPIRAVIRTRTTPVRPAPVRIPAIRAAST